MTIAMKLLERMLILCGVALMFLGWMTFGGGDNSVQATDAPLTAEEVKYAVMIDAGSSGSRVYIYQWPTSDADTIYRDIRSVTNAAGDPQVLKIEPGLSSYRDHPQAAVDAFRPLISFASKNIPREKHHETPLYVLATAGMRMLREADRKQIFESVREGLTEYSDFRIEWDAPASESHLRTLSGTEEGLFVWIAANYIMDNLKSPESETTGCLDMGGGSAQIAYEVQDSPVLPDSIRSNIVEFSNRKVFVSTLLGFGANEGRRRYVARAAKDELTASRDIIPDPCLPPGLSDTWHHHDLLGDTAASFEDVDGAVNITMVGTGNYTACRSHVVPLMTQRPTSCPEPPCSFQDLRLPMPLNGLYGRLVGIAEYWYTMEDVFKSGGAYDAEQFNSRAKEFCARPWPSLMAEWRAGVYPKAKMHRFTHQCFKAAWMSAMLHDGYRMGSLQEFSSASLIGGLPVQWTLGAVLYFTDNASAYPEVLATLSADTQTDEATGPRASDTGQDASQESRSPVLDFFMFFFGFLALGVCIGVTILKVNDVITGRRALAARRTRSDSKA